MSIDILKCETVEGNIPLDEWLADLKDRRAKARVLIRLDRLELGVEGHWRSVGDGVRELKIPGDYSPTAVRPGMGCLLQDRRRHGCRRRAYKDVFTACLEEDIPSPGE